LPASIDSIYTRDGDKVRNAADDLVTDSDELDRAEERRKSSLDL
jgi:hypothetical protein